MKIELDDNTYQANRINSYTSGSIQVGNKQFNSSTIVTPSNIISNWPPRLFSDIQPHHFDQIIAIESELFLFGTGSKQCFPSNDLLSHITKLNINFEFMDTGAACRSYNILLQEGRNIVAVLLMI